MYIMAKLTPEIKKEAWGDGPWVDEPNLLEFEHKGLTCFVQRIGVWEDRHISHLFGGYFCGYVVIPKDHPWYGVKDEEIIHSLEVHGGITYCDFEPIDWGDHERFVIGFDCAHSGDTVPSMKEMKAKAREETLNSLPKKTRETMKYSLIFREEYRTYEYAIEQTKSLAEQAKAAYKLCDISKSSH